VRHSTYLDQQQQKQQQEGQEGQQQEGQEQEQEGRQGLGGWGEMNGVKRKNVKLLEEVIGDYIYADMRRCGDVGELKNKTKKESIGRSIIHGRRRSRTNTQS